MSRILALALATAASMAVLIASGAASANNDPHRIYLAGGSFDLPAAFCGFPTHMDVVSNEYAKVSTLADGSTMYTITGSAFVTVTNPATSKTVTVNASGPGTLTYAPDGVTTTADWVGMGLLYMSNATDFGFPSNIVWTSGPAKFTADSSTLTLLSVDKKPHVLLDVCAALAP